MYSNQMPEDIVWIGGWASPLDSWAILFDKISPKSKHHFWNGMELEQVNENLKSWNKAGSTVVGWSLGSLLMHNFLIQHGPAPDVQYISLNPIFNFCRRPMGWPEKIVIRMEEKLLVRREEVIRDFLKSMMKDVKISKSLEMEWLDKTTHFNAEQLKRSLAYLRKFWVEWIHVQRACPSLKIGYCESDSVSPKLLPEIIKAFPNHYKLSSHLPFFSDSNTIMEMLSKAT